MNKAERLELERVRQWHIRKENEAAAEMARWELERVSCGAGCDQCGAPDCPHAKRVDAFEIPE